MPGFIRKRALYLHRRIGSCGTGHGELEMCSIEPTGEPLVIHADGRSWSITWSELAQMADEAFLKDSADENRPEQSLPEP